MSASSGDGRLQVTVLGCSGTYAGPGGACTGYLVQSRDTTVMLDCGPGTLANLQQHVEVSELDALVITHSHPDHWAELPVIRNVWKWVLRAEQRLPVFTTADTWRVGNVAGGGRIDDTFGPTVVKDASTVTIGDQQWRFSQTDHPVETLAVRVDANGRSFAFSSDTGPGWSLEALAAGPDGVHGSHGSTGIDLAFVESTYTKETSPGWVPHLLAAESGATATAAGVRHLVLTHLLPGEDPAAHLTEARTTFGGSISVAKIHERYEA